ncbi:ABC transporter substrate-binding protein, partial [Salmonella enterica subsp. enterica serovar 1,4,[5],12:i:-]|nr:ABC transporter substrate-binding protein [Salmonella enterica subsp. enterica serovar 1,4,[5],12:i:-]
IDGFCVGEPWNSLAVSDGSGVIIATKSELWAESPEKVLAMRADYAVKNAPLVQSLIKAVHQACTWLEDAENRRKAAELLSRPHYVGLAEEILLR